MRVLTNHVANVYYTVDMVVENLANDVAIAGVLEETREVQTNARRHAMLVLQVQKQNDSTFDIVVSINVVSFVPSSNSMDAYPDNVKTYDYFVYRVAANALRVEVKVEVTMEINVLIVNHGHSLANGVVRNEHVETKIYVLVSFVPNEVDDYVQLHYDETKVEVN